MAECREPKDGAGRLISCFRQRSLPQSSSSSGHCCKGGFFDDFVRLYDLANYGLLKLLVSPHGGHLLLASNGAFALFWILFDLEPSRWFAAVLALHVLNTLLLYSLLRRLECRRLVAATFTALWGICPAHTGVLVWMAVFGHLLLATIVLLLLRNIVGVAARRQAVPLRRAFLWWFLGLLGAASFANGIGIAIALPLVAAAFLFDYSLMSRRSWTLLASLPVAVPALYVAQQALYDQLFDVPAFQNPRFHVEIRELPGQLLQMAWLTFDMIAYGLNALLLGSRWNGFTIDIRAWQDFPILHNLWLVIPPFLLSALSLWALAGAPRRLRGQALGLVVLVFAATATLAVGGILAGRLNFLRSLGWTMNMTVLHQSSPLRYHYVPTLFLAALLGLVLETIAARSAATRHATGVVFLATFVGWLALRAPMERALVARSVFRPSAYKRVLARIETQAKRSPPSATAYLDNQAFGAGLERMHSAEFPGIAALAVIWHPDGVIAGRSVRFVESDSQLLATLQAQVGTPIARLVVGPASVPREAAATAPP